MNEQYLPSDSESSLASPEEPLEPLSSSQELLSLVLTRISFGSTIGCKYVAKHAMRLSANIYHNWSTRKLEQILNFDIQNVMSVLKSLIQLRINCKAKGKGFYDHI
ncbi:unnamed protein product [Oppiella nova]|uniref:Uncharacterized protein n=1 Tax=Oppiella nova TaxID=334625 RepID=A0A7R9LGD0_9ACAR|nr:unnamed protein product [Oppiella nova]CAG2162662.1 unnamed protein product [Oppiella nova]